MSHAAETNIKPGRGGEKWHPGEKDLDPFSPSPDWEAALQVQGWSSRVTPLLTPLLLTLLGKLVNNYVAKAKAVLKISR